MFGHTAFKVNNTNEVLELHLANGEALLVKMIEIVINNVRLISFIYARAIVMNIIDSQCCNETMFKLMTGRLA
ncbi:MAG: hypothetical protein ABI813_05140 [Bacteroidota bacterium]